MAAVEAITYFAVFGVAAMLVCCVCGWMKLRTIHLAIFSTPLLLLSLQSYTGGWAVPSKYALGLLTLVGSYYLFRRLGHAVATTTVSSPSSVVVPARRDRSQVVRALTVFVVLMCMLQFVRGGIPILGSNVEVARFQYASSGLLGIPSRMYLFGLPIALALTVSDALARGVSVAKDAWVRFAFGAYLVARLLSGFKSGLLEIVTFAVLLFVVASDGIVLRKYLARTLLAGVASIGFVLLVGSSYQSYSTNGRSLVSNIENRLTTVSAAPVATVMQASPADLGETRKPLQLDFEYLTNEYFHVGQYQPYGFTRLIAARVDGAQLLSTHFVAPVTMSAYAVLYYQFGWYYLVAILFLGAATALGERAGRRHRGDPIKFSCAIVGLQALLQSLTRGEFVYLAINWGAALGLLLVLGKLFGLLDLTRRRAPWRGARPRAAKPSLWTRPSSGPLAADVPDVGAHERLEPASVARGHQVKHLDVLRR